jgi:alanine racemase
MRNTYCEISLPIIKNNLKIIQDFCGDKKVCAVIKADAYGHSIVPVAKALAEQGVDYVAVAIVEEGKKIRDAGITTPILLLAGIEAYEIDDCIKYDLTITASSLEKLNHIAERSVALLKKPTIHLKIDTGMSRIGAHWNRCKEYIETAKKLVDDGVVICEGIYSHFADTLNAEFTKHQFDRLDDVISYANSIGLNFSIAHICSSRSIFMHPEYHMDMVRAGISLYGIEPESGKNILPPGIMPALSWKSHVVYFKVVMHDEFVGYGRTWQPKGEYARIATIPVGYADGFPRRLSNIGGVIIRGRKYPIAGRVCMDQIMVDLGMDGEAYVGDVVTLIGADGKENISAESIAESIDTTTHEITTCISGRVPRIIIE